MVTCVETQCKIVQQQVHNHNGSLATAVNLQLRPNLRKFSNICSIHREERKVSIDAKPELNRSSLIGRSMVNLLYSFSLQSRLFAAIAGLVAPIHAASSAM